MLARENSRDWRKDDRCFRRSGKLPLESGFVVEPAVACARFGIRIPGSADQDYRYLPAGWQRRYRDPRAAAVARGRFASVHRDRESSRGRRQHRHRRGGPGRPGRIYARHRRCRRADGQSASQSCGDVVRPREGFDPGHAACRDSVRAGGVAAIRARLGGGCRRGGQSASGRTVDRPRRYRHRHASDIGAVQPESRRAHSTRRLSRHCASLGRTFSPATSRSPCWISRHPCN